MRVMERGGLLLLYITSTRGTSYREWKCERGCHFQQKHCIYIASRIRGSSAV